MGAGWNLEVTGAEGSGRNASLWGSGSLGCRGLWGSLVRRANGMASRSDLGVCFPAPAQVR